jgi:hypothetical protein
MSLRWFAVSVLFVALHGWAWAAGFGPPVNYPVGMEPFALIAADVNHDGVQDLVVSNEGMSGTPSVSVLLGKGDGTFRHGPTYTGYLLPWSLAAGDFNNDGNTDVAIVDLYASVVDVLLGNGDGSFAAPLPMCSGCAAFSVASGDLNGDGNLDLVVSADPHLTGQIKILLGNGTGEFTETADLILTGAYLTPGQVDTCDFNHDGKLDIATLSHFSDTGEGDVGIFLGNGDGTFQTQMNYGHGFGLDNFDVGDVNRDGNLDIVLADSGSLGDRGGIRVLLGTGNGSFQDGGNYRTGSRETGWVALGDFNRDGILDAALATFSNAVMMIGEPDGAFQQRATFYINDADGVVVAADLDGDDVMDLIISNGTANAITVLLNRN